MFKLIDADDWCKVMTMDLSQKIIIMEKTYVCVQNKFVHIVEESDYFVSFMYCGIYSILITYEYDLEYWIDKINTIFGDLLMEKQRFDL